MQSVQGTKLSTVDEHPGEAIRRGDGFSVASTSKDPDRTPVLKVMVEHVAETMDMGTGRWRLELVFEDGSLVKWHRHEEHLPAGTMARYESEPDEAA